MRMAPSHADSGGECGRRPPHIVVQSGACPLRSFPSPEPSRVAHSKLCAGCLRGRAPLYSALRTAYAVAHRNESRHCRTLPARSSAAWPCDDVTVANGKNHPALRQWLVRNSSRLVHAGSPKRFRRSLPPCAVSATIVRLGVPCITLTAPATRNYQEQSAGLTRPPWQALSKAPDSEHLLTNAMGSRHEHPITPRAEPPA